MADKARIGGFLGGALFGAVAIAWLLGPLEEGAFGSREPSLAGNQVVREAAVPSKPASVADRLATLLAAAEIRSARDLESEIERVIRSPDADDRDRLEALLLRYLELDPARATRFAARLPTARRWLVSMFDAWATADFGAAIDGLADVGDERARRHVALALVGDVARSQEDIERLAAIAGAGNRSGFVSDALVRLAETDPFDAVERVMEIDDYALRESTARRIAAEWARNDARAAVTYASGIAETRLRSFFHLGAVSTWAAADPDAALEYLASAEGRRLLSSLPQQSASSLMNRLVVERPESALAAAANIGGAFGESMRSAALRRQVELDLPAALARFETLPNDTERQRLLSLIVSTYARQDIAAALAWAESLDAADRARTVSSIIVVSAQRDPVAAVEMALANPDVSARIVGFLPNNLSTLSGDDFRRVTERLVAEGPAQQGAVQTVLQAWPGRDAEGAWSWLLEHGAGADSAMVSSMAAGFGANGVTLPAQSAYALPDSVRGAWVTGYASAYARSEPDAAVEWLRSFAGEPSYDRWAAEIVDSLMNSRSRAPVSSTLYPRPAAQIIATMQEPGPELAARTAVFWTQEQPQETIRWAHALADPEVRSAAVAQTVGAWTVDDPAAARQWVLGLPSGALRDRALTAQLAQEIASHGSFARSVLAAFSSQSAREQAMKDQRFAVAFSVLGSREPETALKLVEGLVEDAALRQNIVATVDRARTSTTPRSKRLTISVFP